MDSSRKTMKGLGIAYEKVQRRYGSGKLISEPLTNYQDVPYSQYSYTVEADSINWLIRIFFARADCRPSISARSL